MSFTNNPTARAVLNQVVHDPRYPNVMHVPTISWPQISLVTLALAGFGLSSFAYLTGTIPLGMAMFINLITVYISFTPLHFDLRPKHLGVVDPDIAHPHSLARSFRKLVIGTIAVNSRHGPINPATVTGIPMPWLKETTNLISDTGIRHL